MTNLLGKINSATALALVLVVGVTVVVAAVTWFDIRQAKAEFFAATELRGVVLAGSIAEIVADPIYQGDVDKIRDVASIARQQEDLEQLQVVAEDGRLLVDPMGSGPPVGNSDDPLVLSSLQSRNRTVERDGTTIHVVEPVQAGAQLLGAVHLTYGDDSLGEFVSELTQRRILIGTILAFVSFAAALIVARIVTSPVRNLTSTARTLATGRMDARATPNGPSEFTELALTFNDMANRLQESQAEQTELNQAKTRFFSSITHELKSPLTASSSFIDLLARDPDHNLSDKQTRFLEVIRRNNSQLLHLVEDLLDIGKVETGKIDLSFEEVDLNLVVERVVENMTPLASGRRQKIVYEPRSGALTVRADVARIEQVVTNLVSNALKYSEDGTEVRIRSHSSDHTVYVTVEDSGCGIQPGEIPNLFQPFHRAPEAVHSGSDGVGLGLYVVDRLVRMHGGNISVKSNPGVGSTFSVGLPVTG